MGQMVTFTADVRDMAIMEAAQDQMQAIVTVPVGSRWVTLKTRIVAADAKNGFIALSRPIPEEGMPQAPFVAGQCVSLTFRRGHRKCMCVCLFVRMDESTPGQEMWVRWPQDVLAVQRRAYFRAPAPEDLQVPVRLWRGGRTKRRLVAVGQWPSVVGSLNDCSAGGMRMDVEAIDDPHIPMGEPVAVEFAPLREVGQICLDANFRHALPLPSGKLALGLQFVGLESSAPGRQMLLVLGQVSVEFLKRARREPGRPNQHIELGEPAVQRHNGVHEPARPTH